MVFLVLSRQGYDDLTRQFSRVPSPIWINTEILSDAEMGSIRASGCCLTNFLFRIDPSSLDEIADAVDTVRQHHPGDSIWVEQLPDT